MLSTAEKKHFEKEGYLIKRNVFSRVSASLLEKTNQAILDMALEINVHQKTYLNSVSRWDSPNSYVESIAKELKPELKHLASSCLEQDIRYVRSSIFRKSESAYQGTHGHQDAGYWNINSSNIYDISTWIAFEDVDQSNGALRVLPRSHITGPVDQADFLLKNFKDPAMKWGKRAKTLVMRAGDIALFSPYLWHSSHPSTNNRTRTAFVTRWRADAITHRLPERHNFTQSSAFGMVNSSEHLQKKLALLVPEIPPTSLIKKIRYSLENDIHEKLPEPQRARESLERLLILTIAHEKHHANDSGIGVWQEIRDSVIMPDI